MIRLPYPFNSPWVRGLLARWGLAAWFLALGPTHVANLAAKGYVGNDARIYIAGAREWLAGRDPWSAAIVTNGTPLHFAAPPPNLVPIVPFALLPDQLGEGLLIAIAAAAAVAIVRLLRLPWWWLLFPPLMEGVMSGNPQVALTALLLAGGRVAMIAPALKVYALAPIVLLGRWRQAAAGFALLALASIPSAPLWPAYLASFGTIGSRLADESNGGFSAWAWPPLVPVAVVAVAVLLVRRRRRGAWLAVPALWPASELHYSTFAMPVIGRRAAWLFAVPIAPLPAVAVIGVALAEARRVSEGRQVRTSR